MNRFLLFFFFFSAGCFNKNVSAQNIIWANQVEKFSSQTDNKMYSARQVLGAPNSLQHEESKVAWMPSRPNAGMESITVTFEKTVIPATIIVHENYNPGSIAQVIVSNQEKEWLIYENKKPAPLPKKAITSVFQTEKLKEPIQKVTIILNTAAVIGYNQIDAIGVSTTRLEKFEPAINTTTNLYSKKPISLGPNINSVYDDMLPILSPDGSTLYFARKNASENIGDKKNDDIYAAAWNHKKKQWNTASNIGTPLNNTYHNFVVSISPDGNTLYLSGTYDEKSDRKGVSYSTWTNGKWSMPKSLEIKNYYNRSKYACYHVGVDEKTMVMALERDDSYGDMDLYVSFKYGNDAWSEPVNLGKTINTAGIEASVFLAADGKTIYFSSDGHAGYGGLDMFMSKRLDNTWQKWSEPVNLGPQINTPYWDVYYTISASGEYAFFSSENNALGGHDLFQIELPKELRPEPVTIVKANIKIENEEKFDVTLKEIPKQTTSIIAQDEKPTSLYKSFKGYFPLETDIENDTKVDKSYLKEEDDYKNVNLKTGEMMYQTDADKKLFELQQKLQDIKKEQAVTNVKLEKYNPYAPAPTTYQSSTLRPELEAAKKSYSETAYLNELEEKLNKLKASKEMIAMNQYTPSTRLESIPKKEVVLKESTEPSFTSFEENNKKLEELKALRDAQQVENKPQKKIKNLQYDPNDERIKYIPKENNQPKEDILASDPEIEAYRKKLQEIKDRYLNTETADVTTPTKESPTTKIENQSSKTPVEKTKTSSKPVPKESHIEYVSPVIEPIEKVEEKTEKEILLKENEEPVVIKESEVTKVSDKKEEVAEVTTPNKSSAELQNEKEEQEKIDKQIKALELEKEKMLAEKKAAETEKQRLEALKKQQAADMIKLQKEMEALKKTKEAEIASKKTDESKEVVKDIALLPIKVGAIFEIKNIFFNANSSILKEESYEELNKIVAFLTVNDNIAVEIGGHTNGLCTEEFCNQLSQSRARVVTEYLIAEGIEKRRLSFKGYGKTIPIASNETEDGRKRNQRVELKIMEILQ